jgi:hypothetical protein
VAEHLEEHGFVSLQRRKLMFSSEVPVRRLAEHDERIAAHWDGLVVNRPESVAVAEERLAADDPWERATAIRFWLTAARTSTLMPRLAEIPPEHAASWREAMRAIPADDLEALVPPSRRLTLTPLALGIVVDAAGWNGRLEPALARSAAGHGDPTVRAAVARHASLLSGDAMALLRPLLDDAETAVRRRALWSLALIDQEAALEHARARSRRPTPEPFAVRVVGLLGEPDDHARISEAAATDAGRLAGFYAFADFGTPEAIESLIRLLTVPDLPLALAATEALELALGTIPREAPDGPAMPQEARAVWAPLEEKLPKNTRVLAGHARPWRGASSEEPGAFRWRAALRRESDVDWRREVPDGFFEFFPVDDARPGE